MIFHFPEGIFMVQICIKLYFLFLSGSILPVEFQKKVCLMLLIPHSSLIMVLWAVMILIPRCVIIFPRSHLVSLAMQRAVAQLFCPHSHQTVILHISGETLTGLRIKGNKRSVRLISFHLCKFMRGSVSLWESVCISEQTTVPQQSAYESHNRAASRTRSSTFIWLISPGSPIEIKNPYYKRDLATLAGTQSQKGTLGPTSVHLFLLWAVF